MFLITSSYFCIVLSVAYKKNVFKIWIWRIFVLHIKVQSLNLKLKLCTILDVSFLFSPKICDIMKINIGRITKIDYTDDNDVESQ